LAVMDEVGIKLCENEAAMPASPMGCCVMTCSMSYGTRKNANFLVRAEHVFKPKSFAALPLWKRLEG